MLEIDQSHARAIDHDPVHIDDDRTAQEHTLQVDVGIPRPIVVIPKVLDELNVSILVEG